MAIFKIKLQVLCADTIAIGPGKAELLDQIAANGSISAAARQLGMSYRRAWQLVDVMNRCWAERIVETTPGRTRGGARLTEFGATVLARYRSLQHGLDDCAMQNGWPDLAALMLDQPLDGQANSDTPSPPSAFE